MIYAIVETGGKQYRVTPGQKLDIDLRKKELSKKRLNLWGQHEKDTKRKRKENEKMKARLKCESKIEPLFTVRWKII